jgi:hypothetical protein
MRLTKSQKVSVLYNSIDKYIFYNVFVTIFNLIHSLSLSYTAILLSKGRVVNDSPGAIKFQYKPFLLSRVEVVEKVQLYKM